MSESNPGVCPVSGGGCPLNQPRFELMATQISQVHSFMFGVNGKGGIMERVEVLEKNEQSRAKAAGWIVGITTSITFVGTKLWEKLLP